MTGKRKKVSSAMLLSQAYKQARKRYDELLKAGFQFDKRTQKLMSDASFQAKSQKPTKRTIEQYKGITKANLYKRSKGFYDIDSNSMLSVEEGKRKVRERKKEERVLKKKLDAWDELSSFIGNIDETVMTRDAGEVNFRSEKNSVLSAIQDQRRNGASVPKNVMSKIESLLAVLENPSETQDDKEQAWSAIESVVTDEPTESDIGFMSMIGTPFESE